MSKRKNVGGRPRKDGSPARRRVLNPKGRLVKSRGEVPIPVEKTEVPVKPTVTQAGGSAAGAAAVQGLPGVSAAPVTVAKSPAVQVNYDMLVKVLNGVLTVKVPQFAMTNEEEKLIGDGVEAVVTKYFPALKNAGPEFALVTAISAWAVRVLLPVLFPPEPKQTEVKHEGRPSVKPNAAASEIDPYAHSSESGIGV